MNTTRNIFKRENFSMKNTENDFHSSKQFEYLSLHIDDYVDGESSGKDYYWVT